MPYNRISADCHLDLIWLPPDLFTSEAPAHLKDRMPYVADGPDERWWVAKNGVKFGIAGGVGASGTKHIPGKQLRVDVMAATGLFDDGKKGIKRPADPHLRIKEMDRDGVDAEVMFGILGAASRLGDHEAANEVNLPLHFHTFPSLPQAVRDRQVGLTRRAAFFTSVAGFQMNLVNIIAAVIGAGVLERYPNIRISFGE